MNRRASDRSSPVGAATSIERANLNELITVTEAEHGPVTDEEVQSFRDQLHQARKQQTQGRANCA
ncbi:hypothetical protein ACLVWQ_23285 [Streptomyces sp. CWNU-52B]|uniref:hypothetical protein n=1 Tax=unclassified Streptomyces TaxID=2593676 RepID=UPI0039C13A06